MKKVKITHAVDYKGASLAKGLETELEDAVADRLIANGHAVEITEKAKVK